MNSCIVIYVCISSYTQFCTVFLKGCETNYSSGCMRDLISGLIPSVKSSALWQPGLKNGKVEDFCLFPKTYLVPLNLKKVITLKLCLDKTFKQNFSKKHYFKIWSNAKKKKSIILTEILYSRSEVLSTCSS